MRANRATLMTLLATFLASGSCGSGSSSGTLDCDWLRADSCWKQVVEEIRQCAPKEGTRGSFSSDTVCEYDDGTKVQLDVARSTDHLAIVRDGNECLRYDDDGETGEAKLRITTNSGTLSTDGTLSAFTLTCPNGSSFFTESPMALYSCGEGALMPPGMITTSSQGVNLALKIDKDEDLSLIDCD